jgi:hypothetical protein
VKDDSIYGQLLALPILLFLLAAFIAVSVEFVLWVVNWWLALI